MENCSKRRRRRKGHLFDSHGLIHPLPSSSFITNSNDGTAIIWSRSLFPIADKSRARWSIKKRVRRNHPPPPPNLWEQPQRISFLLFFLFSFLSRSFENRIKIVERRERIFKISRHSSLVEWDRCSAENAGFKETGIN